MTEQKGEVLRVLVLEDSKYDVALLLHELWDGGYTVDYEVADTADGFRQALARRQDWDVILSDYMMGEFTGAQALQILQQTGRDIPFIIISGTVGEEIAVAALKAGANDFLIKDQVARLVPVIEREIQSSRERQALKQAEAERRRFEDRLRWLSEMHLIGIAVVSIGQSMVDANDAMLEMLGYTRDELETGKLTSGVLFPRESEDTLQQARRKLRQFKRSEPFEIQMCHKQGHRVDVLMGLAMVDEQQEQAIAFAVDISPRKQAERLLRESEARFRLMADTAPVFIWLANTRGECTFINKRWMRFTGRSEEAHWGAGWLQFLHPEDRPAFEDMAAQAFKARRPFETECRIRSAEGEYRWILLRSIPRFTVDKTFAGYVGSGFDITARKQAETDLRNLAETLEQKVVERTEALKQAKEEAETANLEKSRVLSYVSHDLKTPISTVMGYGEMLESGTAGPLSRKQLRYVHNILSAGQHLLMLVNNILDQVRLETGQVTFSPQWVDLSPMLEQVRQALQPMIDRKAVAVHVEIAPDLKGLEADVTHLHQVFFNLMSNAVKYNRPGGHVYVRLEKSPDGERMIGRIRDTGIGIPPDQLAHLFTEYYRIAPGQSSEEGTGLGLWVVKKLVELHGGTVTAESQEDVGSTFTVTIPLKAASPAGVSQQPAGNLQ